MEELERQAQEQNLSLQPLTEMRRVSQEEMTEKDADSDPLKLTLNPDHIVLALEQFHHDKEEFAIHQQLMGV
jgi:hypothetical protein